MSDPVIESQEIKETQEFGKNVIYKQLNPRIKDP